MGAAHTKLPLLLDMIEHQLKKGICTCTKGTIRGQNKGDENSIVCPSRRLDPGVAYLSHFDITKKGIDTTPHVRTAAPHGRVTRKASNGHVHQDTFARRTKAKQIGSPFAEIRRSTRIFYSDLHMPSIAVSSV